MNLRQLTYFVRVAEERHFGRAARILNVTQPPLSQQIKALEEELGVTLLERTTRSVELTPAGERLLLRARDILAALNDAALEAQRAAEGLVGSVALSFVGSATYALLPQVVRALRSQLPDVHLALSSERLTAEQVEALLSERIDLAVLSVDDFETLSPQLSVEPIRTTPLVAALSQNHPLAQRETLSLIELAEEPLLLHPSGGRSVLHRKVRELCAQAGFRPKVAQEVSETVTAVSLAAGGVGVAILPESVRALSIAGTVYRSLRDADAHLVTALALRRGDQRPVLQRVLTVIRECLALERG
ncbi:LysR family transcriptional regulator [Pseudenhygromyxa sp. WMMC2535]|uniref:LysR family transcriptional regulator n=1 Tax=Pseudenhygromyxa sp. WMMC2535 TaxID=2712867 RepID=UPI0015535897|nr:LysR family transcriptional regulator [Pseudenhygromyxa sp. WMMC2535]NVB42923.1 LysR family transcriptional regulator [Pseudenhygromyxa sp. WMMC2535]